MMRLDDLQNGFKIWQDPDLFCFGVDAVLLAHYPRLKKNDRICDLGTGFAPIPLILKAEANRFHLPVRITGLEIQDYVASIARKSVADNGLSEEDIHIVTGDLREAASLLGAGSCSLVTCNPPYMPASAGLVGGREEKAIARTELKCTMADVAASAGRLLNAGGRFSLIHRPQRLVDIFLELRKNRLEPKRLRFVHPYEDAAPTMVLVEAVKDGRPYLVTEPPLVIYKKDRTYTEELLRIYGR
ncbi:MAG: methyltransferase [Lachnospiraceae bacterium]|nr:methyltransferase [Lachnospiraceae bacterium]